MQLPGDGELKYKLHRATACREMRLQSGRAPAVRLSGFQFNSDRKKKKWREKLFSKIQYHLEDAVEDICVLLSSIFGKTRSVHCFRKAPGFRKVLAINIGPSQNFIPDVNLPERGPGDCGTLRLQLDGIQSYAECSLSYAGVSKCNFR